MKIKINGKGIEIDSHAQKTRDISQKEQEEYKKRLAKEIDLKND
jgi:hypothetical protein